MRKAIDTKNGSKFKVIYKNIIIIFIQGRELRIKKAVELKRLEKKA